MKLFRDIPGLISIPVNEEVNKLIFFHGKSKEKLVEETILEKYNQYYRLAFSYVHNEADANDIVQNMAYRALRMPTRLAVDASLCVQRLKSRRVTLMTRLS